MTATFISARARGLSLTDRVRYRTHERTLARTHARTHFDRPVAGCLCVYV